MYFYKKCFILLVFLISCNLKSNIRDVRILQAPDGRIFIFLGDVHSTHYFEFLKAIINKAHDAKVLTVSDYKHLINLQSQINEKISNLNHTQSQQIINFINKFQKLLSIFIESSGQETKTTMGKIATNLNANKLGYTNLEIRKYSPGSIVPLFDNLEYIKNLDLKNSILNNYYRKIILTYEEILQKIQKNKNLQLISKSITLAGKIVDKNILNLLINATRPLNLVIVGSQHSKFISQQLIGAFNFKEKFNLITEQIKDDQSFFGILYKLILANNFDEINNLLAEYKKQYETFEKIDLQKLLEKNLPKNIQIKSKL